MITNYIAVIPVSGNHVLEATNVIRNWLEHRDIMQILSVFCQSSQSLVSQLVNLE